MTRAEREAVRSARKGRAWQTIRGRESAIASRWIERLDAPTEEHLAVWRRFAEWLAASFASSVAAVYAGKVRLSDRHAWLIVEVRR